MTVSKSRRQHISILPARYMQPVVRAYRRLLFSQPAPPSYSQPSVACYLRAAPLVYD